jgi:hypothetical protein
VVGEDEHNLYIGEGRRVLGIDESLQVRPCSTAVFVMRLGADSRPFVDKRPSWRRWRPCQTFFFVNLTPPHPTPGAGFRFRHPLEFSTII